MIQVIGKVASILEAIASGDGEKVSLGIITEKTGINSATCANILKALKEVSFVDQVSRRKGYTIGSALLKLTRASSYDDLLRFSFPMVDSLRTRINENVILSVVKGTSRELVYSSIGVHELSATTLQSISAYRASTGRVIISHWSEQRLEQFFREAGLPGNDWEQIGSFEDLKRELQSISKSDCYCTVNSNHVFSMAAPIFHKGEVIASVGFYMPYARTGEKGLDFLKENLLLTARNINSKLL